MDVYVCVWVCVCMKECVSVCVCVCAQSLNHVQLCDPTDYSPLGSSVHGTFQARILQWVAIFYSKGSSPPRDQIGVSCIGRQILYHWATWEAQGLFILSGIHSMWREAGNVFLMPCPQEEYGKQQYAWWLHSHIFSFISNTSLHSPVCLYHPETPQLRRTRWGHVLGPLNWCLSHWSRGSFLVPQGDRLGTQDTQRCPPQSTSQTLTVVTTWVALSCPTLWDPTDRSLPGFSVYGISQARILEWTAISFSRASSRPRDGIQVSCTGRQILYHWATCAFLRYSLR